MKPLSGPIGRSLKFHFFSLDEGFPSRGAEHTDTNTTMQLDSYSLLSII